jgi:hypothetical protein
LRPTAHHHHHHHVVVVAVAVACTIDTSSAVALVVDRRLSRLSIPKTKIDLQRSTLLLAGFR